MSCFRLSAFLGAQKCCSFLERRMLILAKAYTSALKEQRDKASSCEDSSSLCSCTPCAEFIGSCAAVLTSTKHLAETVIIAPGTSHNASRAFLPAKPLPSLSFLGRNRMSVRNHTIKAVGR